MKILQEFIKIEDLSKDLGISVRGTDLFFNERKVYCRPVVDGMVPIHLVICAFWVRDDKDDKDDKNEILQGDDPNSFGPDDPIKFFLDINTDILSVAFISNYNNIDSFEKAFSNFTHIEEYLEDIILSDIKMLEYEYKGKSNLEWNICDQGVEYPEDHINVYISRISHKV